MSEISATGATAGTSTANTTADREPADWSRDGIEIRKADGLQGKLGLYEVTADGQTRYMTKHEADALKQSACGAQPCFTDADVYSPGVGANSYAQRAWTPKTRTVDGDPGPKYVIGKNETTAQSEIDRLKKSSDPKDRRMATTIENARVAYADLIAAGGKVVVTTSPGNDGQPVVVITGPNFDPKEPARVHTHYHGDNATAADPRGSKAGTNARIQEVIARNPQTVFVVPESLARPGQEKKQLPDGPKHDGDYKASWANAKSQAQTTDDALATIGVTRVSKEVVSFHSRGGEALQQIMKDTTGSGLRADRVELHDCLYGSQYKAAEWARTDNGRAVSRVVFYHGSNRANAHDPVQQAFGSKFTKVEMGKQKPLDDTTNPVHRDPDGKTYTRYREWTDKNGVEHVSRPTVRQFDPDPHYRTTGQFLDASD